MAMHNTNTLLKYVVPAIVFVLVIVVIMNHLSNKTPQKTVQKELPVKNTAAHDSAAESLDTLTAELSETKQKISEVSKNNDSLKKQNGDFAAQLGKKHSEETQVLTLEMQQMKNQIQSLSQTKLQSMEFSPSQDDQAMATVSDLTQSPNNKSLNPLSALSNMGVTHEEEKAKAIPYYTVPANATSVKVRLMTALVGRIPVKGVVVDPYPFKLLLSDDNLAANGLRIPHLLQMIVSGYCEGDLGLQGVRGWITSLTFVFDDGTISTTTSNDNDIGNFTKSNSLGYLSDKRGNPFIPGMKFISNAPMYMSGNIALGMGAGAANAYAQSQTTSSGSFLGNTNTSVTGSQGKYMAGQALSNGTSEALQWWHDREQQSFDAIYVSPTDEKGNFVEIAVNFSKEIHIDYDPKGRKLNYEHDLDANIRHELD